MIILLENKEHLIEQNFWAWMEKNNEVRFIIFPFISLFALFNQ